MKEVVPGGLEEEGPLLLVCPVYAFTQHLHLHLGSSPPMTMEGSAEDWAWTQPGEAALTPSQSSLCPNSGGQCHSWHVVFASFLNPVSTYNLHKVCSPEAYSSASSFPFTRVTTALGCYLSLPIQETTPQIPLSQGNHSNDACHIDEFCLSLNFT